MSSTYTLNGEQYKIIKMLGNGSFGEVYLAEDSHHNKFALKMILKTKFQKTPILLKYTQSEVQIMQQLKHPNILELLASQYQNEEYALLLEYCEGGDLSQHIKNLKYKKEFNLQKISEEFLEILDGFEELHSNHIIHRDVKPDNILYKNGHPKVSDFGFSKNIEGQNDIANTALGTPQTMAPEVYNKQKYTYSADIFGLGIVLYYMIYQRYPFNGYHYQLIIDQIKNQNFKFPKIEFEVDDSIINIIQKMLNYDPSQRPSIGEIKQISYFQRFRKMHEQQQNRDMSKSKLSIQTLQIIDQINQNLQENQEFGIKLQKSEYQEVQINQNYQQIQKVQIAKKQKYYQIDLEKFQLFQKKTPQYCNSSQYLDNFDQSFIYTADERQNDLIKFHIQELRTYLSQYQQIVQIEQIIDQILQDCLENFRSKHEEKISQFAIFLHSFFSYIENFIQDQLQQEEMLQTLKNDQVLSDEYKKYQESIEKKKENLSKSSLMSQPTLLKQHEKEQSVQLCRFFQSEYYELSQQQIEKCDEYFRFQLDLSILSFFLQGKINLTSFNVSNYLEQTSQFTQKYNSYFIYLYEQP